MAESREDAVHNHFRRSREVLDRAAADPALIAAIAAICDRLIETLRGGGKILIAGNGGSAADAQHIAAEFLSRFVIAQRTPLPAIALSTDTSVLTAIGNDFGFEHVFARQVRALGRPGDAFIAISTSGRSPNVLAALREAREVGVTTIGLTGSGGDMRPLCDLVLAAPADDAALVQQIHITAAHAICGIVERGLFAPDPR